ncbi:hypothetical protein [Listeria monocytogenes]|uniref:hypothetical protein n=1 Tax=Listeria monocytogenes TaxID=1639 RepID=UPI000737C1D6|nr:hypothetical protein [Listeria monocytogenes]EAD2079578.1 hypothetical protein [Listeria monocytogenes]EAH1841810.1 hypothetical protein [Listeria monocytogenes]ECW2836837.1 hypothetical protein [Listeria monocytogenes]EGO5453275.1 hypothetical protein [Listeria monocytogenes]EGT2128136.1 hypothetical protein [Listeria monocytogenes]
MTGLYDLHDLINDKHYLFSSEKLAREHAVSLLKERGISVKEEDSLIDYHLWIEPYQIIELAPGEGEMC